MAGSGFAYFCRKTGSPLNTFTIQKNESATTHDALANAIDRFTLKACFLVVRKRAFIVEGNDAFLPASGDEAAGIYSLKISPPFGGNMVSRGCHRSDNHYRLAVGFLRLSCRGSGDVVGFLFSTMTWKGV